MRNESRPKVEILKRRDNSEYLTVDGRIILKWVLSKLFGRLWTRLIRLRTGTLVNTVTFGFHERQGIS
jgi:hypothetical protein